MATYFVNFHNNTDRTWTMAVYQTLPNPVGLNSVSWLQSTAPQGGATGVRFDLTFNVAFANYRQDGGIGVYEAVQILPANLGTAWQVVFKDGVQQLEPSGSAPLPEQILITNASNHSANPGIGMSGSPSVYKPNLAGGTVAQFYVTPSYYVGLFNNLVPGEVISNNAIVGPQILRYPPGGTQATVTADLDGENTILRINFRDMPPTW